MRGWRKWVVAVTVVVAVGGAGGLAQAAEVFPFEGHGTSSGAAAPAPLQWEVISDVDFGADFWLLDGLSDGAWPSSTSVTDFHITFTERIINDTTGVPITQFVQFLDPGDDVAFWTRVISPDKSSVDFFAPAGVSLDQGENFFIQVRLVTDASAVPDFTAHWTTSVPEPVPEPASLTLLGTGLIALFAARRRRVQSSDTRR